MSAQRPEDDINALAAAANASIRQKQDKAAAAMAAPAKPSVAKQVLSILLLLAFVAIVWVQYPRFHEPFGRPDPNKDVAVAEADLDLLAAMVESYRLSQGKYPATLDQVRLPESLAALVAEQKIVYRQTESAYVLDWNLPSWHVAIDGETGKVDVTPVKGGK